jgi:hypothetical protein
MSLTSKLLSASGGVDKLYSDSVFSAYTYTGNGATQTINNGIDLAGKSGLVWTKSRTAVNGTYNHAFIDTARGVNNIIYSDLTIAQSTVVNTVTAFNASGYSIGNAAVVNNNPENYVSWTFRKASKFFDVVIYTGNGTTQNIAHSLDIKPGMVIVKKTTGTSSNWIVYHQSLTADYQLRLNLTDASNYSAAASWGNNTTSVEPTSSQFTVGSNSTVNNTGDTYVAYLFAHDTSADSIVKCGSFTTDGSGNATVDLGWEPQFFIGKRLDGIGAWYVIDVSREMSQTSNSYLKPDSSNAEQSSLSVTPNATGFKVQGTLFAANAVIAYIAIRRSNKPPTLGTQVYNAIEAAIGTSNLVGFSPDFVLECNRSQSPAGFIYAGSRLQGNNSAIATFSTAAEVTNAGDFKFDGPTNYFTNNGYRFNWLFKRAVGVFDEVCYTGDGTSNRNVPHNLGAVPELVIIKLRSGSTGDWLTVTNFTATTNSELYLNTPQAQVSGAPQIYANATLGGKPTASNLVFGYPYGLVNSSGFTYVAYLFASKLGISKVFSYIGNGSSQTIDCGFTTGARFVMIKRTDAAGDWLVGDSTRGIVDASDPRLSLNTTAAEVTTDDWLDTNVLGFVVNQTTASNANVSGATYIGLSFA